MKKYLVVQNQPLRIGLLPRGFHWEPIFDTDNHAQAVQCAENWQQFTGYQTLVVEREQWEQG